MARISRDFAVEMHVAMTVMTNVRRMRKRRSMRVNQVRGYVRFETLDFIVIEPAERNDLIAASKLSIDIRFHV